ncbi:hypothetical protein FACS1894200_10520 [Spirochaetia bacterium]|nr:hypothetical protein FACS1894200_10520 [Spirochaetia bacterium]
MSVLEDLANAFFAGMAAGQLLMVEEQLNKELHDQFNCHLAGVKYCESSSSVNIWEDKSEKWFEAMRNEKTKFGLIQEKYIKEGSG